MRQVFYLLCISIFISSCQDRFDDVKSVEGVDRIVLESFISTINTFEVKLSRTVSFGSSDDLPKISGAEVKIISNLPDTTVLNETFSGSGVYTFNRTGVEEISYKLSLVIESVTYESPFIKLLQIVPIGETSVRESPDDDGFYAYACLKDTSPANDFYVQFYDTYRKDGMGGFDDSKTFVNMGLINDDFFAGNVFNFCTPSEDTANIFSEINDDPFEEGDSVLFLQYYHVNQETYEYWEKFLNQTQGVGGPFDTPPSSIVGNVRNTKDQKDFLLGYFTVGGMDRDSIIITDF